MGLRPRQTATLISMATSVGIMLLTLAVLLASSASLRNALLNYDAEKRLANLNRIAAEKSRAEAATARQEAKQATTIATRETQSARNARLRAIAARKELQRAQRRLQAARLAENAARRGENAAKRGAQTARLGERRAIGAQREAQSRAQRLRTQLATAKSVLDSTGAQLRRNSQQLASQRAALSRVRMAAGKLFKDNGSLIRSKAELTASIEALQARRATLEQQNRLALASFIEARDIAASYGGVVGLLGAGKIAVGLGQVFAETRLAPASEPARVRATLRALLDSGAEEATRLGGQPYTDEEGGPSRALHLAPRPTSDQTEMLGEAAQIEQLANFLATYTVPISLRLTAARNYAEGETRFEARLGIVPVKRAFVAGETLTSSTIDGTLTDAQLFNALLALMNAGEAVARSRGVAPLVTEKNPNFYAEGTNERIFDVLREVQMQAKLVRVRLLAAEDASTVDNLRVRFVIERLAS
jgi:uncharacterized protein (DUF3084 family)